MKNLIFSQDNSIEPNGSIGLQKCGIIFWQKTGFLRHCNELGFQSIVTLINKKFLTKTTKEDVVALREKSKNLSIVKAALEGNFSRKEYVSFNENEMSGMLVRLPERDEFLKEINEQLIVEFYNQKL